MPDKHQPRAAFVEALERRIEDEALRRNRLAATSSWPVRSTLRLSVAAGVLAVVSMAVGGAVVAAAYQAQNTERRNQIAATYEQRLALAQQNLDLAIRKLRDIEVRSSVGLANKGEVLEGQNKVSEARTQTQSLELQVQEVRLTGREPLDRISSPLVSGRDFVGDRLRNDMMVPRGALAIEQERMQAAQTRVSVGVAFPIDVEIARAKIGELRAAVQGYELKLGIRQRFLKGEIGAVQADLRVLEGEAEQQRITLALRIDLAQKQVDLTAKRVQAGLSQRLDLVEAALTVQQLKAELAKAEFDLAVIRQRLGR